jgi:hypothetical protein
VTQKAIAVVLLLLAIGLLLLWPKVSHIRSTTQAAPAQSASRLVEQNSEEPLRAAPGTPSSNAGIDSAIEADSSSVSPEVSGWKTFLSNEYNFEVAYPANWSLNTNYDNNYGQPPSGNRPAGYAGETRTLMRFEIEGPTQDQEGGGDFSDGAIITARVTGTKAVVEDWTISPGKPWSLLSSTLSEWVALESSPFSGDKVEKIPITTNDFTGVVETSCNGSDPCKLWGEAGGAYRILPSGRAVLISWERMNPEDTPNDFSYQKYFLPLLASFKSVK